MANPFSFSQAVFFKRETAIPINQDARILDFGSSLPRACALSLAKKKKSPYSSFLVGLSKNCNENPRMHIILSIQIPIQSGRMRGFSLQFLDNQPENCCSNADVVLSMRIYVGSTFKINRYFNIPAHNPRISIDMNTQWARFACQ